MKKEKSQFNNIFWAVYNKKGRVVSISKSKEGAQEQALGKSKYRWTFQTIEKDWSCLEEDGYKVLTTAKKTLPLKFWALENPYYGFLPLPMTIEEESHSKD